MKPILLGLLILLAAALPARAGKAWVALAPIPYGFVAPQEIAARLSAGPLAGASAEQAKAFGARAAVTVYYRPQSGGRTILFSAYYFDAGKWDAAQRQDGPPPFGRPVFRGDGRVLSVAGPHDMTFDPDTEDGRIVIRVTELLRDPASFEPVE